MSPKILLASLVVTAFASCSTAYKSGQTPDDVYYSPVRTVQYEEKQERDQVRNDQENYEDREIRMRIQNQRWRYFEDNYGYNYGNYNHYCNCYCNQGGWGYYNHPYANPTPLYPGPIKFNSYTPPSPPRVVNLGGYNGSGNVVRTYTNPKTGVTTATPRYNNSNSNSRSSNTRGNGLGNAIREIFTPSSNNSNNNSNNNSGRSNNTRTYEPTSTPSNSGSSAPASSGGSVTRPGRGG